MKWGAYYRWRWRAFREHRDFVVMYAVHCMAMVGWFMGALYSNYGVVYYQGFGNDNSNTLLDRIFPDSCPPAIGGIHFVMIVWTMLPVLKLGVMNHSKQGIKFTGFAVVSIGCCVSYHIYAWAGTTPMYFNMSDSVLSFCILQFAPCLVNNMGLPPVYTWYMFSGTLLFWVLAYVVNREEFNSIAKLASLLVASAILALSEACHEADLVKRFGFASHWIAVNYGDVKMKNAISMAGDVANNMLSIHSRLNELETLLRKRGFDDKIWVRGNVGEIVGYRFDMRFAKLYEARQLCHGLLQWATLVGMAANGQEGLLTERQVDFTVMCSTIFAWIESSKGHGFALFINNDNRLIHINGPEGLLQMILYLLIIDGVDYEPNLSHGVVSMDCFMVQGKWYISVTVVRSINSATKRRTPMNSGKRTDSYKKRQPQSSKDANCGDDGSSVPLPSSSSSSSSSASLEHTTKQTLASMQSLVGEFGHSTSGLAIGLAGKYLHTKIETKDEVDESGNCRVMKYSFAIPGRVSQIVGVDRNSNQPMPQTWLLLTWRKLNSRFIEYHQLAEQLKILGVPYDTCNIFDLEKWEKSHNVLVTTEAHLNFKEHSILVPLLQRAAKEIIIISDQSNATPEYFLSKFRLRVRVMSADRSIKELLRIVNAVYSLQEPRVIYDTSKKL
jgi:hypothetical protein